MRIPDDFLEWEAWLVCRHQSYHLLVFFGGFSFSCQRLQLPMVTCVHTCDLAPGIHSEPESCSKELVKKEERKARIDGCLSLSLWLWCVGESVFIPCYWWTSLFLAAMLRLLFDLWEQAD
jgi:hypothetical protein